MFGHPHGLSGGTPGHVLSESQESLAIWGECGL